MSDSVLPTVLSLAEAERDARKYSTVVSLVHSNERSLREHPHRLYLPCEDTVFPSDHAAPNADHIHTLLSFVPEPPRDIMVHCLMGHSRSTAVALVLLVAWGWDPDDAASNLASTHPPHRPFIPNALITSLADSLLGCSGRLSAAAEKYWSYGNYPLL